MRFVVLALFILVIISTARAQEPACNATGLASPAQTNNSISLTWNPGCGSERLVLMAPAFSAPCFPVDFMTYGQSTNYSGAPIVCGNWRSVFSGPGTTVTVSGLSSGTSYDVMVFEFGSGPDYRIGDQAMGTFSTSGGGGGGVQAGLALGSVSAGQVTLALIVGDGGATLIGAQSGTSFTGVPINNSKYCAEPAFPTGQNIPGGGFAVGLNRHGICGSAVTCSETPNSFNVTGLTPGTTYTFRAFEFDGCSSPTYNINPGIGNPLTVDIPFTEPTTQASNLAFSLVATTSMTVTWTSGNGQNRILVGRASSAVSFVPQDGQAYTANSDFSLAVDQGSGNKVLYAGSANTVNLTNLMPGITYHFQVFESNGPAFNSFTNYLTSSGVGNPASRATFAPEPTIPALAYNATAVTTTSMTLSWTNGNGFGRIVLMDDSPFTFVPVDGTTYTANSLYTSGLDLGSGTKCVFNGTGAGSSVGISGLTAGTTYHFLVIEYNGTGSSTNYMTTPGPMVPFGSLYNPPSTTPVNITFSSVTTSDMTVGWTNGNGTHRIVVARSGAAVNFSPTDGVNYVGNSNFFLATDQGLGNKVVYSGSGNSVPITGLSPTTVYHFRVFESNPAGGGVQSNYLISPGTGNPASRSTLDSEPTNQTNSLLLSNVQAQSLTLNWVNGNGTSRIVIADDAAITFAPVDGTTYTANANYSAGTDLGAGQKCVYNGTGGSATITGLLANTTYTFRVFEYNGASVTTNYLVSTATGNPASGITLFAEPTVQASGLTFTAPATTGLTINWTPGNGTSRVVIIDDATIAAVPTDGTSLAANADYSLGTDLGSGQKCVYNGVGSSVAVTGLSANTLYHVRVYEYNGAGTQTNYLAAASTGNPGSRKTLFAEPAAHAASFTATAASSTQINLAFSAASTLTNAAGFIVLRRADGANPGATGINDGTAPASLPLTAGTTLVTNINSTSTASFDDTGLSSGIQYNYALIPYGYDGTNSETYNYRTAITIPVANNTTFVVEPSAQPTTMAFSAVASTSFTVSFTPPTTAPAGYIAFRKAGSSPTTAVPVDGATYTVGNTLGDGTVAYVGTNPTFNETSLTPATLYFYDIFAYNGAGGITNYLTAAPLEGSQITLANQPTNQPTVLNFTSVASTSYTVSFTASAGGSDGYLVVRGTGAMPTNPPTDGLSYVAGASLPDGTIVSVGAANSFAESGLTSNTMYHYAVYAYNGTGGATNYVTASPLTGSQLTLPAQPTSKTATSLGQTSFTANWDPIPGITEFFLDVSLDNYTTFATVYQNKPVTGTSELVSGLASGTTYQYRVRAGNATGQSVNSNDQSALTIPATPTSSGPSVVTQSGFTAAWNAVTGAVNYHLDIARDPGFTDFLLGFNDTALSPSTLTAVVTGLPSGTTYYYQVRASNGSGTSPSSTAVTVPTIPATPVITIPPDNRLQTSFLVTWSAVTGATSYFLDVTNITANPPVPVSGYVNKVVTGTFHTVVGLTQQTNYQVVLRAGNSSGSSGDSEPKYTQTTGIGPDPSPVASLGSVTATTISANFSEGIDPKTIVLFHRKIADAAPHTAEPAVEVSATGTHTVDVKSTDLDELGMEYYFELTDFVGRKSTTAKGYIYQSASNKSIPNLSAGGKMENYRIFSIPLSLSNNRIESIFSSVKIQFDGSSKEKWRIVRYQNKKNVDYPEVLTEIKRGEGYWINSIEPLDLQISGSVAPANQNMDFSMELSDGWNQIGNPFPFDISWADVKARNPGKDVGPLYIYNPAVKFDQSNNLKAWGGGFVRSTGATTLTIPVVVARGSGRIHTDTPPTPDLAAERWYLPIKVVQGHAVNDISGIGMSPSASNSFDSQDELSLPRFVNYLELNGYHPENPWTRFMKDVAATAPAYTWNLRVESNWDAPQVTLSWDNSAFGTNDAQLILFDHESQNIINMRQHNQYTVASRSVRELKIMYARTASDLQPGFSGAGVPYPNPFNRLVSVPVIIQGDATEVELSIYDLMGRRVAVMGTSLLDAGIHTLTWEPLPTGGEDVPDGIYVYRLRFKDGSVYQGRILRKKN